MEIRHILNFCIFATVLTNYIQAVRYKTVYQKIQEDPEYIMFSDLVKYNRPAINDLLYSPLTVFVPDQNAFEMYDGESHSDLAFYHMSFEVKTLKLLKTTDVLFSVKLDNPPLWISKVNEDIYVNNAKILLDKSNYISRSVGRVTGQQQVLHVVDRVLDPLIKSPPFSPNAYDFLTLTHNWNIGESKTVNKFYQKVQTHQLLGLFKNKEPHTFFIPLDSGMDLHKYKMVDKKVILRHVVPNYVMFTRPSEKNVVTISDEDEDLYTFAFETNNDKLAVKCLYKPYSEDDFEEFTAEVIIPNIPVKNGVVHLMSQPLGNFNRRLKPFPYLPIMEKITNDPQLDVVYKMGSVSQFNKIFEKQNVNFTYFVIRDSSWFNLKNSGLEPVDDIYNVLAKHLVISETPYSMQQLASMTRINNYTDIVLKTVGGPLGVSVFRDGGNYYIKWKKKYIEVIRPDYECSNGLVHIISGPLVDIRQHSVVGNSEDIKTDMNQYWNILKGIVTVR